MKKLFFLSLLLLCYLISAAQDTIPKQRNTPNQITTPDQLTVPKQPGIQNQSVIPNQQNVPTKQNVPAQSALPQQNVPVQPSVPQQVAPVQPSTSNQTVPVQPLGPQQNAPVLPSVPQQIAPIPPTASDQPAVLPPAPVRSAVTVPPSVPVQVTIPTQPSGAYQPAQSTTPNRNQNNIPSLNQTHYQSNAYQPMSEISKSENKAVRFTFIASPQVGWMTSGSRFSKSSKSKLGFAYGIESDIFLGSDRYSLLTGFVISSLGGTLKYEKPFKFNGSADTLPAKTKIEYFLRYIEIPLAIKLRSKNFNNNMRFFAQFGLDTWMNIKAKGSSSDGSFNKEIINDEVRFFAIGLNVGGGVEYDLGDKNSLTAGIIYSGSFNDATINSTIKDKTTINSLRIRLGFIF